eukprot:SAG31_NODE_3825_length_3848_cov_1.551614_5_plen_224_part_00
MLSDGVLPVMMGMLRSGNPTIQGECMRALADLAEAVDNRVSLAYRGLDGILPILDSENRIAQEEAVRFVCNLLAPAGFITSYTAGPEEVGRYGSVRRDSEVDDASSDEDAAAPEDGDTGKQPEESAQQVEDADVGEDGSGSNAEESDPDSISDRSDATSVASAQTSDDEDDGSRTNRQGRGMAKRRPPPPGKEVNMIIKARSVAEIQKELRQKASRTVRRRPR